MTISATCATIALALASARGGEVISLTGTCKDLLIRSTYHRTVTIDASRSTVYGLTITGANIRWSGGRIVAPDGVQGKARQVYGALLRGARNVSIENVTFGLARKALVTDQSDFISISNNRFDGYGEDGIISSSTTNLTIERNRFTNVVGKPSTCNTENSRILSLSRRDCLTRNGEWIDGFHADAIQLRNGVKKAVIQFNYVYGRTQGITQMDTTGDAPLEDILIADNEIWGEIHHITLGGAGCIGCRVQNNKIRRFPGAAKWKAVIRQGPALRCGNDVQDETRDRSCKIG